MCSATGAVRGSGNLSAYRSGSWEDRPPIVVFDYQPRRAGAHAGAFPQEWRGHLMADDYAGYEALFAQAPTEPVRHQR